MFGCFRPYHLVVVVLVLQFTISQSQTSNNADAEDNNVVSDGKEPGGRDDESTAKTAVLVTAIVCAIGTLLCCGAMFYLIYQKCCVEECII